MDNRIPKITIDEEKEKASAIEDLPYRLSMFVTLLKKERQIKAEEFVYLLNKKGVHIDTDINNNGTRELRLMKEQLIEEGFPIGSCNFRGYFFINNRIDESEACNEYVSKAKTMLIRANRIKKNVQTYHKLTPDQMTLFQIEERRAR